QLIDASDGFHIWSQTYDRELTDIFAIQDEISAAIVKALVERLNLTVAAVPKVQAAANTEAYDQYLLGIHQMERRGVGPLAASIEHFEKSLTLDPDYAPAMARLSMSYSLITSYSSDYPLSEALAKSDPLVARAMELAPGLAEVHAAMGLNRWNHNNWMKAEAEFERAIAINPSYATVYNWLAQLQGTLGRYGEQLENNEKAVRADPLSVLSLGNLVEVYAEHGRLAEARALAERLKGLSPWHYHSARADIADVEGRWADQALALLGALAEDPKNSGSRAVFIDVLALGFGLPEEALKISGQIVVPLIMLDRRDEAVDLLEHVYKNVSLFARTDYAWALQEAGRDEESLAMYELDYAEWMQGTGGQGFYDHWQLQSFATARRRAGDEAGAMALLKRSMVESAKQRDAGINIPYLDLDRGAALYLMGQTNLGLRLIAKGASRGGKLVLFSVHLEPIYADPGFAPIRADFEARQIAERDKFLAAICNDGNPAPEVWTPAPETCEGYLEAAE
ncbi:MAG: tetratricopeptide repeat protein, partial [Sphingomonadales bacterium]